jgi:hypothetical protein
MQALLLCASAVALLQTSNGGDYSSTCRRRCGLTNMRFGVLTLLYYTVKVIEDRFGVCCRMSRCIHTGDPDQGHVQRMDQLLIPEYS